MIHINSLIINLTCLDMGIVPLCEADPDYLTNALDSLSLQERRETTRKFRKLLKRAIHQRARDKGLPGSIRHKASVESDRERCGLCNPRGALSGGHRNFRAHLVRTYLRETIASE